MIWIRNFVCPFKLFEECQKARSCRLELERAPPFICVKKKANRLIFKQAANNDPFPLFYLFGDMKLLQLTMYIAMVCNAVTCMQHTQWQRDALEDRLDRQIDRNTDALYQNPQHYPMNEFNIYDMFLLLTRRSNIILEVYRFRAEVYHRILHFGRYDLLGDLATCNIQYRDLPLPESVLTVPDEAIIPNDFLLEFRLIAQQNPFSTSYNLGYMIAQVKDVLQRLKHNYNSIVGQMDAERHEMANNIVEKLTDNRFPAEMNDMITDYARPDLN